MTHDDVTAMDGRTYIHRIRHTSTGSVPTPPPVQHYHTHRTETGEVNARLNDGKMFCLCDVTALIYSNNYSRSLLSHTNLMKYAKADQSVQSAVAHHVHDDHDHDG